MRQNTYRKAAFFLGIVPTLLGCRHETVAKELSPTGSTQWILESYAAEEGYRFTKDGTHYLAHCSGYYLSVDGGEESYYSRPTVNIQESTCSAVLPYLHKPIPLEQKLDALYYRSDLNKRVKGRLEFTVARAK